MAHFKRWWLAIAALVVAATVAVVVTIVATSGASTAGSDNGPRPVTSEEAARLATMRVTNFEAVGVAFHSTVVTPQGDVTVNGDVNFHSLTGYGEVSSGNGQSFTLEWNAATLLAWPSRGRPTAPPATLPTTPPRERALSPSTSSVDTVLALLLGLGESRPDDATQVRQDGARWLRASTIDGTTVDVMQGPSPQGAGHGSNTTLDFWVDRSGHLLRVDVFLGGFSTPTQIDLDPSTFNEFPSSTYLTAG